VKKNGTVSIINKFYSMVGRRSKYTKFLLTKSYSNTNLKLDGITQLDRLVFNSYVKQVRQINKFLNIIHMFVIYSL
jgi:hypothetical protein